MTEILTEEGSVTIPKAVQDHLGIAPGSPVQFRVATDGKVVLEKAPEQRPSGRFESLRGIAGPGMSTDEMMALLRGEPE
ncbi:AbrB/MazE/SpoVT family DNA-binding domain-containing protein [Tardiphaga sp.]|jgi:antitoxin PrlF|uniref:AbrB/MazE/SpoVT family DNA-binding domain-containing protein n=1 Tax=Tardiphaga sp. TaxID=1926292 RepID=UPI0037D9D58A